MYIMEGYMHDLKVIRVCWQTPDANFVKLNIDGSALDNPNSISVGEICRYHLREL